MPHDSIFMAHDSLASVIRELQQSEVPDWRRKLSTPGEIVDGLIDLVATVQPSPKSEGGAR